MDDDINLDLSPNRKSAPGPKVGRRAFASAASFEARDVPTDAETAAKSRPVSGELFLEDSNFGKKAPPPHGRRTGGWADETGRAKTGKSLKFGGVNIEAGGGIGRGESDEDDGPVIPDLDDVQDEDLALQIADAPAVAVNRVDTYKELDNDLLKHVAYATLDDIDLRLLTRCMAPEQALKEPDDPWTWDIIFAEVSGDLQKEWFPDEDEPQKEGKAAVDRPYTALNRFPV